MGIEGKKMEQMGGSIDDLLEWAEMDIKSTEGAGRVLSEIGKAAEIGVLTQKLVEMVKDPSPEMRSFKERAMAELANLRGVVSGFRQESGLSKEDKIEWTRISNGLLDKWSGAVRDVIERYEKMKSV